MRTCIGLLMSIVLLSVGCEHRSYELELTPQQGKLKRQLTGHIEAAAPGQPQLKPLSDEELTRIAAQYGAPPPRGGGPKHTFAGEFLGRQPDDIGGHGGYYEWTSEFGTARLYVERFRGDDDLVEAFDRSRAVIARFSELLLVWVDDTWTGQPEYQALRRLVERDVRRDLENLVLYLKAAELQGAASDSQEASRLIHDTTGDIGARIPQYLIERDYLDVSQLPRVTRAFAEMSSGGKPAAFMLLLQDVVRRKLGIAADQPLPGSLAIFGDAPRLLKSLNESLRKSDEYRAKLALWEQTPVDQRSELPDEPVSVLSDLLAEALHVEVLFGRSDRLAATLRAATKPIVTNGAWDEARKTITWKKHLASEQATSLAPEIIYALWAEPAEAAQDKFFRGVTVRDQNLFDYCLWRNGLTPAEVRQWTGFLSSLQPEDQFAPKLREFRFAGETDENDRSARSSAVRELLIPEK